jgi:hypothetical protein
VIKDRAYSQAVGRADFFDRRRALCHIDLLTSIPVGSVPHWYEWE